jgi:hypothetical protein
MGAACNVKAIALIHDGKPAGKIVAVYSEVQCTVSVSVYRGPLAEMPVSTESTRVIGSNKLDACLENLLLGYAYKTCGGLSPLSWLEQVHGYQVIEVI